MTGESDKDRESGVSAEQDGDLAEQVERVVALLNRLETLYSEGASKTRTVGTDPRTGSSPIVGDVPDAVIERFAPVRPGAEVMPGTETVIPGLIPGGSPQSAMPPPIPSGFAGSGVPGSGFGQHGGALRHQPYEAVPQRKTTAAMGLGAAGILAVLLLGPWVIAGFKGIDWRGGVARIAPDQTQPLAGHATVPAEPFPTASGSIDEGEKESASASLGAPPPAGTDGPAAGEPAKGANSPEASPAASTDSAPAEPASPLPKADTAANVPAAGDIGEGDRDEPPPAAESAPASGPAAGQPAPADSSTQFAAIDPTPPPVPPAAPANTPEAPADAGAPPAAGSDAAVTPSIPCDVFMGDSDQTTVRLSMTDAKRAGQSLVLKVNDLNYRAAYDETGTLEFKAPRLDATTWLRWVDGDGSLCQKAVPGGAGSPLFQVAVIWGGELTLELHVIEPRSWPGNPVGHISPIQPNSDLTHGFGSLQLFGRTGDPTRVQLYTVAPDKIGSDGLLNLQVKLAARPEGGGTCGSSAEVFDNNAVPYEVVIVRDNRPDGTYGREVKSFAFSLPPCNAVANQQRIERMSVRF